MSDEYIHVPVAPKRKYTGEYIGTIETGVHDKYLRVQVRVLGLFDGADGADLPFAIYKLPVGARVNDGFFTPAKPGDYVWVDFPFNGDTRRPRITGSVHYAPGDIPELPDEAWDGPDKCQPLRTGLPAPVPEERAGGLPCVYKQNGVCVEILGEGTVRVTNTTGDKKGSNIEINKAGEVIIHAVNSLFLSSKENQETAIHGDLDITVLKDVNQTVQGNVTETTKGQHNISGSGGINITSDSTIKISAPSVEIN